MTTARTSLPIFDIPTVAMLGQRVRAATEVLLNTDDVLSAVDLADDRAVGEALFAALAEYAQAHPTPDVIWLLWTAATGELPSPESVTKARRQLELCPAGAAVEWLQQLAVSGPAFTMTHYMDVITDAVLVDCDFSAKHQVHTGIQRVTRSTVPIWHRDHDIVPVAWLDSGHAMRLVHGDESQRLLRWHETHEELNSSRRQDKRQADVRIVVPWRSVVVLAEVPAPANCARLSALAEFSGNRVAAIGYDCIPIVSASLVGPEEPLKFVEYLRVIKHSHRVAGISASAATEFRGFTNMLPTQGLTGPIVFECLLGTDPLASEKSTAPDDGNLPVILSVGSIEERKNQLALLAAAEELWREGLRFALRFIGGGASSTGRRMLGRVAMLRQQGRQVSVETGVSESTLADAFRGAYCTVFASLHEGYGLPVAESLAYGVPVITSRYGSTAELGRDGGVVLVDPRDDDAILGAVRRVLTDPQFYAELRREAGARPQRSWQQYADELWETLVLPEQAALQGDRA